MSPTATPASASASAAAAPASSRRLDGLFSKRVIPAPAIRTWLIGRP
jgi:hypothetical protein